MNSNMNTSNTGASLPSCHVCGQTTLQIANGYEAFWRVTSDCKPWPPGGSLARCASCGLVQTPVTPEWGKEADKIYTDYTIYHQSGGAEQNVFDSQSGAGKPRSDKIIQSLGSNCVLPTKGRLLDIGCGNGSFLSAWSRLIPGWSLCGSEVSEKYKARVESITGVEKLYTCDVNDIPGSFDVISLVHVLEHIPSPFGLLQRLSKKLKPGGLLVVEVPDCEQNVFMLLVADHCTHFSPPLLAGLVSASGLQVLHATNSWVAKEITLVAQLGDSPGESKPVRLSEADSVKVFGGWKQLEQIVAKIESVKQRENFGLFGTAIAATWLDAQTERAARFFVEEDKNRVGRIHLGRPILATADLPLNATIFVALPQPLAGQVAARLAKLDRGLHVVLP